MLHTFSVKYNQGVIKEYEKHMLTTGGCNFFLPMSFISDGESDTVIYNYEGYVPIADIQNLKLNDMLDTLEKVFSTLLLAGEHLINPARISINSQTIYKNASTGNIKLAYMPSTDTQISVAENITTFISMFEKQNISRDTFGYLEKLREYAAINMSVCDLITQIGLMKREVRLCGLK